MLKLLRPSLLVRSVADINITTLYDMGIRVIFLDIDNTIAGHGKPDIEPWASVFIKKVIGKGLKIYLFSNNNKERVEPVGVKLGIEAVYAAGKPRRRAYRRVLKALGLMPWQAAAIGDQLLTDILGGNRIGVYTIMVSPINNEESKAVGIMRPLEKLLLKIMGIKRKY